jgi:hypothetical protein
MEENVSPKSEFDLGWIILDCNKMKCNTLLFCLDIKNNKMNDANTEKLKETLKNKNNRRI